MSEAGQGTIEDKKMVGDVEVTTVVNKSSALPESNQPVRLPESLPKSQEGEWKDLGPMSGDTVVKKGLGAEKGATERFRLGTERAFGNGLDAKDMSATPVQSPKSSAAGK